MNIFNDNNILLSLYFIWKKKIKCKNTAPNCDYEKVRIKEFFFNKKQWNWILQRKFPILKCFKCEKETSLMDWRLENVTFYKEFFHFSKSRIFKILTWAVKLNCVYCLINTKFIWPSNSNKSKKNKL